jgi:hypothetical protein
MPSLAFTIDGAEPVPFAASPELALKLSIANAMCRERVHGVLLRCQVRIEAPQRAYSPAEAERLADLFGRPAEWGRTLRGLLWTQVSVAVPAFEKSVRVDLPLPCSYDFSLATVKYFHSLAGGEVPLSFLFSGTIFYAETGAEVQASPIPSTEQARYGLPHRVYAETIAHYHAGGVPLSLSRDVFDRLLRFRTSRGFASWERTIESLLPSERDSSVPAGERRAPR